MIAHSASVRSLAYLPPVRACWRRVRSLQAIVISIQFRNRTEPQPTEFTQPVSNQALSRIRAYPADFYSHTGRPSVDPELLIRMLLVGYCFGIRSERCLYQEVHLNLAYRWSCMPSGRMIRPRLLRPPLSRPCPSQITGPIVIARRTGSAYSCGSTDNRLPRTKRLRSVAPARGR